MRQRRKKWVISLAVLLVVGAGLLGWIYQAAREDESTRKAQAEAEQREAEIEKQQKEQAATLGEEAGADLGKDPEGSGDEKGKELGSGDSQPGSQGQEGGKGNGESEGTGQKREVTMAFAGDILLSSYVLENYKREGISGVLSEGLLAWMQQADIRMANEEFPFTTGGVQAEDKQFTFRVNPSYTSVLKEMGLDVVTLANNHALDYGKEALSDTFAALEQAGIAYVGAGDSKERAAKAYKTEAGGKTFGFLAASRVIPEVSWNIENQQPGMLCTYDSSSLAQAIRDAKAECDYVTVYVHWGIEREDTPQEYQRKLAKAYIDAGADLVIGAHPHVLQGIEYYNGKPIVYSLGNYIFNQTIERTMLLRTRITPENETVLQVIPAYASGAKTQEMEEKESTALYRYLESISFGIKIDGQGKISQE